MDSGSFSSTLDPFHPGLIKIIRGYLPEGSKSTRGIKAELYRLCIYGKGSFFKPHVHIPRIGNMFASLVVVFPTPHEGGTLFLRHRGREWIFYPAQALAAVDQPTIGYVAFFNDIEREVAPVTSGHRITLPYNLYFDDGGPISEKDAVSDNLIPLQPPNQEPFHEAFKALLGFPVFMAEVGILAFGLRHIYPIEWSLSHLYNALKGSDAVMYQSMHALGFEPMLYVYYDECPYSDRYDGATVDKLVEFGVDCYQDRFIDIVQAQGGILVRQDGGKGSTIPILRTPSQWSRVTCQQRLRVSASLFGPGTFSY